MKTNLTFRLEIEEIFQPIRDVLQPGINDPFHLAIPRRNLIERLPPLIQLQQLGVKRTKRPRIQITDLLESRNAAVEFHSPPITNQLNLNSLPRIAVQQIDKTPGNVNSGRL